MANLLVKPGRKLAKYQLVVSLILTFLIAIIMYLNWGYSNAVSALVGGVISIIPNSVFAYKTFKYVGASSSKKVIESFYSGEKMKMVITVFLLALAFKFLVIIPIPFFLTFFLVMIISLLTPILFKL